MIKLSVIYFITHLIKLFLLVSGLIYSPNPTDCWCFFRFVIYMYP